MINGTGRRGCGRRRWAGGKVCLALVAVLAAAGSAKAQRALCHDPSASYEQRIAACTSIADNASLASDVRAEALISRGTIHGDQERLKDAVADFSRAIELAPGDVVALILRGNARDALDDKQGAIADYTEAIRRNPDDAAGYFNRASVHHELGQRTEAIADYKRALEIDPEYEEARAGLAELSAK